MSGSAKRFFYDPADAHEQHVVVARAKRGGRCKQCAEEIIDHQRHKSISRCERRFRIADGVKSELTEQTRVPVLGVRDERYRSCGIEQDDIASSEIYYSVVLHDFRSAHKLNHGVIVLRVITANIRSVRSTRVALQVRSVATNPKTRRVRTLPAMMSASRAGLNHPPSSRSATRKPS